MKMLHVIARACGLGAIALVAALTLACHSDSEKLENQDAFKTQVDRIDRAEKDVDAIHRQMSTIERDLQQVSADVANLAKQGGGDGQGAAREQRLQQVEAGLKAANAAIADMGQRLAKPAEPVAGEGRPRVMAPNAPGVGKVEKGSVVAPPRKNGKVLTVRAKTEGSSQAKPRASEARGVYHRMAEGETLDQVARQYKTSASAIRAANGIPRGREPIAGQSLFVPIGQ
jgi:LysM repeat protein